VGQSASPAARTPSLSAAQASTIATGLTSTGTASAAAVLAPDVAAAYRAHPGRFWPAGTTLTIDWRHLQPLSATLAVVPAVTAGSVHGRWTIVLENTAGRWGVLATRRAGQ